MNTKALTWGKVVLVFQAVVTLLIGVIFFLQVTELDQHGIQDLKIMIQEETIQNGEGVTEKDFINVSQRFEIAGYILLVVSLIEFLIISRFIS